MMTTTGRSIGMIKLGLLVSGVLARLAWRAKFFLKEDRSRGLRDVS